ncbi:hypothetical protein CNMCM6936_003961 [Aspergillus lentulus]|nr:hypothetical protein CNMCM6936_003961 [Aspergillus lentulus]
MQPRIMQMRLHVAVAVKPQRRVSNRALGARRTGLRDGRMQLGGGCGAAVAVADGGTGEIQERAPGAAGAPSGVVCFVDGAERGAWGGGNALGDGEIRRRKDLLVNARKEKNGLEDLLNAMAAKSRIDNAVASIQDKEALVGSASRKPARSGRVLGKETERTRELDNQGVLQLQKQTMEDQDMSIEELRKIVQRQKELGIAINAELEIQNELLKLTDEDTDRLEKKIEIGKKRVGKIS